ncbi:hypothetical protein IJT93_04655 [bacterium]|nr:hypothetical protein [bacterium]
MSAVNYSERPDERMPLNETAVIIKEEDGFGIIIEINSEDRLPAHMHVFDASDRRLIAKVIIPSVKPDSINSIHPYQGYTLTDAQKKVILDVMLSKRELGVHVWKVAILAWNAEHPDSSV